MILNLKEVRLRMHGRRPDPARAQVRRGHGHGRRPRLDDQSIEVLNPEHEDRDALGRRRRRIELTVDAGKGYRSPREEQAEEMPIGTIPIDSIFSPVRRSTTRSPRRASVARPTSTG